MLLEAKEIHKRYTDGRKVVDVLKGVGLTLNENDFVALVGPSGAGKSTLLHIIGGLDSPTKGKVMFGGRDLYAQSDASLSDIRNKSIGFIFQFYYLLPEFTVLENVLMPAMIAGTGQARARERALDLLERVGLKERLTHFPNQLSGGEQQRVAIVRALMNRPRLLLCDEPTGNLDSATGEEIIALIREVSRGDHTAVVVVTHNAELAQAAERVYHLKDGILH
ncbi:MAG: ABC transporter ATP-binding protein [Deltaproteobacteria bacterium]